MANLSALTPLATSATALSNLILVSPQTTIGYQPQGTPNADGTSAQRPKPLLFHYEGEQTVAIESDITDHYIEDNTAIADQISLKPELITTHGFIGELNDVATGALALAQTLANKLVAISAYTPAISQTALIAYTQAFQAYQIATNIENAAVQSWESLNNAAGTGLGGGAQTEIGSGNFTLSSINSTQTKQQVAFQQFYAYWRNRILFTVQTPWAVFQNMAIKNLRAIQSAETNMITDFEVTFKMIRTANTTENPNTTSSFQERLNAQASGEVDHGTQTTNSNQNDLAFDSGLEAMGL